MHQSIFDILLKIKDMIRGKKIQQILQFWFQKQHASQTPTKSMLMKWWNSSQQINKHIRQEYQEDIIAARQGKLEQWKKERDGMLAYILLNDQFPRSCYKGTADSFSNDHLAVKATLQCVQNRKFYNQFYPLQKSFILMPLEHSEEMDNQEIIKKQYWLIVQESEKQQMPVYQYLKNGGWLYAEKHYAIVKEFGRYPYRNQVLGRQSTPKEIQWIKNGESFGFNKKKQV